jgi:DNA-binding winged helix-turn-helix (wHTH) protein
MFIWPFGKSWIEDSYTITIFDGDTDFSRLYSKLAIFYHYLLYSKIVDILNCVYNSYNGDVFKFLPPPDYLDDLYKRVWHAFKQVDRRPDFRQLKIVDFKSYPSLFANHHEQIKLWEKFKITYFKDRSFLKKRVPQQYPISNEVRVAFDDIDKLIKIHNKAKRAMLNSKKDKKIEFNEMFLNLKTCTLQFKDNKPIKIIPTNQEIKLLMLLLENKNVVVNYEIIAKNIGINSYHGEITEDVTGAIKIIKNKLNSLLDKAGFRKNIIENVRGSGYILHSIKLI